MLHDELQSDRLSNGMSDERWIVVEFNAWRQQRLDPPWWPLLSAIFRQSLEQLWRRYSERSRALLFWREEIKWRFWTGQRDLAIAFIVSSFTAFVLWILLPSLSAKTETKFLGEAADAIGKIISLITTTLLAGRFVGRSLMAGSAQGAQAFVQSSGDPLRSVRQHFGDMLHRINRPVVVFIDDLDRCQSQYVVRLLEGIQTLFDNSRIVYVIAADGRWLQACYDESYAAFAPRVQEPGRTLGGLFLEKAVQLSVSIPRLPPDVQKRYWQRLLDGPTSQALLGGMALDLEAAVRREFAEAKSEDAVLSKLRQPEADSGREIIRRQVAVEKLAESDIERSVEYFLGQFSHLVEPNPRSMKRLVNTYSVGRDLAILAGVDVLLDLNKRKQLVLWTIVSLRWPNLVGYFQDLLDGNPGEASAEIRALMSSPTVRSVLDGQDVGVSLDLDTIGQLSRARAS